jgi:DNA-binding MarR family transcriptional regulator
MMETTSGILSLVYQMKQKCAQVDQQLMDDLKISQSELLFFSALNNCLGISSPELAKNMGLSLSRISRVVDKLVVNGYLDRNPDSNDRRAITLCLTAKGKVVRNKIDEVRNECESRLIGAISSSEMEQFREVISKIVKNL